jgi:hypothetical protein
MLTKFSTPISELPSFLSTISMVSDDLTFTIQRLKEAEQPPPAIYEPTRDLFLTILQGKLRFDDAWKQASRIPYPTERKCACQVLDVARDFFADQLPARIYPLKGLRYSLPNGLPLQISPIWIRETSPNRLLILHFWQTPFSDWQRSAMASVLREALEGSENAPSEIDFISVPFSDRANRRQFEVYNWKRLKPLSDIELKRFWKAFLDAWAEYQRRGPREIKIKRRKTLFD